LHNNKKLVWGIWWSSLILGVEKNGDKYIQQGMIIPNGFDDDIDQALRNKTNTNIMPDEMIQKLMPFLEEHRFIEKAPHIAIEHIDDPSEETQLKAVRYTGSAIQYIDNPSEAVQIAALQEDGFVIKLIIDKGIKPSEEAQLEAVKKYNTAIQYIDNPSEAVQLEAIKNDLAVYMYIKNPSEKVQLEAVKGPINTIEFIKNPSEAVQLEAVRNHRGAIRYIKNPSKAVQEMAKKKAASIQGERIMWD